VFRNRPFAVLPRHSESESRFFSLSLMRSPQTAFTAQIQDFTNDAFDGRMTRYHSPESRWLTLNLT